MQRLMTAFQQQFAPNSLSDTGERDMTLVGDGGGVVKWNYNDPVSVAFAEKKFKDATRNGWIAFTKEGKVEKFNATETFTLTKPIMAG